MPVEEDPAPENAIEDHEDDADPALGGEVVEDPVGPADLSLPERAGPGDVPLPGRYGQEDVEASTEKGTGADAADGGENTFDGSREG